jgi:photosystem II stability/assembly factor-like uncharacterized protein
MKAVYICVIGVILSQFQNVHAAVPDTLIWTEQNSGVPQDLWSIYFTDSLHGWAAGNLGAVVRTVNGGATWNRCVFPSTDTLYTIVFASPARGWMGGNHGVIYGSNDSGKTWSPQVTKVRTWFANAWCFDSQTVMFAGSTDTTAVNPYDSYGYVLQTVNAGQSWTGTLFNNPSGLESICFTDRLHGWIAGMDLMTRTINGGQTWSQPAHPLTGSYRGYVNVLWFVDTLKGFGAGRYGGIVGTTDGGRTWNFIDTSSGSWIEDICFADPQHGVAVGERGFIAFSSDSGKVWRRGYPHHLPTLDAAWFRSVFFPDPQYGWAAGDKGIIIKGSFIKQSTGILPFRHPVETSNTVEISSPVRSTIAVTFTMPHAGTVRIDLCDMRGRVAQNLAAGPRSAGAFCETYVLNQGIPSGMYEVTLRGKNQFSCARTVIIR